MAAASGTIRIRGASGRVYAINVYANDTANNLVTFDESKIAVAGSPDTYIVKENGAIVDIAFTTDLATPTHVQILRNGTPTGDILDVTAHLTSVTARPNPVSPVGQGDKISLIQLS